MKALKETAIKLGFTYSKHQAMTGSKYYMINSIKFRVSDHTQPSHYQSRQYFDVACENEIIDIISNPLFGKVYNPAEINGEFYNMIYVEQRDGFDRQKLTEKEYNNMINIKNAQKNFYIQNGFAGEID